MAENTTQTTILNVETSKSVKSVKDLKQQIKDLRDKIVELNATGKDASKELEQLGTLTRQYKDINEQAALSSKDLGDQLNTFSGSVKGIAGGISAVTGVMELMGVESEKGTKLLKTMAAAMSITSGIQAMEAGNKAIKRLVASFALATKGAKTAGEAIKAAFASNPVGLLLVALTSVVALMSKVRSEAEKMREELEKQDERISKMAEHIKESFAQAFDYSVKMSVDDMERWIDAEDKLLYEQLKVANETGAMVQQQTQGMVEMSINSFKSQRKLALESNPAWDYTEEGRKAFKQYYADLQDLAFVKFREIRLQTGNEAEKLRQQIVDEYNKAVDEQKKYDKAVADYNKQQQEKAKAAAKISQENAKKSLDTQKKAIADELKLQQAKTKRLYDLAVEQATDKLRNGEITETEYNSIVLGLQKKYYDDSKTQYENYIAQMQALQEQFKNNKMISKDDFNNIFPESALLDAQQKIDDLRRSFKETENDFATNKAGSDIGAKELQNTIDTQNAINDITQQSFEKRLQIESEYLSQSWLVKKTSAQMEQQILREELENENALYAAFVTDNENKLALLQERYSSGLIGTQEYNEQVFQLGQELIEREYEHARTVVDIKKREVENKKAIAATYEEFERSMAGSVSGIFDTLADSLGESNEHYKGLKIAATLIDTLQGSIAAFTGCIQSMGMPYGAIAGAVAAASTIATGMATIKKIQAVDAKNGASGASANTSANAVQTFTTPQTATIATGATNDYTDMMGQTITNANKQAQQTQKVVLVLNDLDDAQSRKVTITDSNTF